MQDMFSISDYMPHGMCLLWEPGLMALHIVSDAMIAAAYFTIPAALIYFVSRRKDLPFQSVFVLFGIFIVACGTTHVMSIITLWEPIYQIDGAVKAITAAASVPTAWVVWQLMPQAIALPSTEQLSAANRALSDEMARRERVEREVRDLNATLELRVAERTAELEKVNKTLRREMDERMRAEEQLRQAQKLEAVGQLTGGVAHDFNNLLTVILGNAEVLVTQLAGNAKLHALAEMTLAAAERGSELTSRLLAFSRRQTLAPRDVDVAALIQGLDEMLRRTLGEHIEIQAMHGADMWHAYVDPVQLESAMLNLAINARDAMPNGGKLTIETSNVEIDDGHVAMLDEVTPGKYVLVAISDSGEGMPQDVVARVFEPFFTTKEVGKGSGLGLSMVYGFVKQSGGHIKIYSEVGQGTVVRLYLPRLAGKVALEESRAMPAETPSGHETILIVEDDTLVRNYVDGLIRSLGYKTIVAEDGPSALAILQRQQAIDLLFTDIVMPHGMSGRDLAEQAAVLRPALKVLFTSGYAENALVHHGRLDPGVQLIAKPYHRRDLALKLRAVLDATVAVSA